MYLINSVSTVAYFASNAAHSVYRKRKGSRLGSSRISDCLYTSHTFLYMGCSDVSEFEHIYGQILTTPSCVYGRLFTWTRMVDFNALIVWKKFIHICFSIKSSLWALTDSEIPKNDLVDNMKLWPPVTSPDVYCYLIQTPGDFTCKSWKHRPTTLWFPGRSSHYKWWSAILVTTAMTQPPPLLSPILPPTSAPPLFNEGLGYHHGENCGIKDVCKYVLEHFGGLMRLIIFQWNKKVNSVAPSP